MSDKRLLRGALAAILLATPIRCGRDPNRVRSSAIAGLTLPAAALPLLPSSGFRVAWRDVEVVAPFRAGWTSPLLVTFQNAGDSVWPDDQLADPIQISGRGAVRLSYRWRSVSDGALLGKYDSRSPLPWPLFPGDRITLPIDVLCPANPGEYRLQFDLVQETVAWFGDRGASQLVISVRVS